MARWKQPTAKERAMAAMRESKHVDFKEKFDPKSEGEWCELLKDFAAVANSGGGVIIIGLRNNATPSGADVRPILDLDPAKITDKLFKYTGVNHAGFEISSATRDGGKLAVIGVEAALVPIVFTQRGRYVDPVNGKEKFAFRRGTVYFRHGAKSEPGTAHDLAEFIAARVDDARHALQGNLRKVVEAPADAEVAIYHPTKGNGGGPPNRIQLTTDANAPVYGKLDPDDSHPHRQTELIAQANKRLPGSFTINPHDVLSVRKTHGIDATTAPQFCHEPKFASQQYSDAFVDWLVDEFKKDKAFFEKARKRYLRMTRRARQAATDHLAD
jgi:Schlafen, AlbA_2